MRIAYHEDVDILTTILEHKTVKASAEVHPGVVADFDHDDQITAFEIMDASKLTDLSQVMLFMSRWGDEDRVLDVKGNLSVQPRTIKAISTGG